MQIMKKNLICLLLFTSTVNSGIAQDTIAIFKRENSFLLGLSPATRPVYIDSYNNYIFQWGGAVRFGYFPIPKLAIIGEFGKYALTSNIIENQDAFNLSVVGRYYFSGVRSGCYANLGYLVSDYRFPKNGIGTVKIFPSHYVAVGGGLSIKLRKNLYLDLSLRSVISLNGKNTESYLDKSFDFGIDYIFNSKYADIPKLKRETPAEITKLGKRKFQVSTGIFYFPFPESDVSEAFNEFLWTSKFGYYLTRNVTMGLTTGFIYNKPAIENDRFFYFVGPYINYKIAPHEKLSLYFETGYNYSNHSIPDVGVPQSSIVHYFNIGGGINYRINSDFYLDAGLVLQNCVGGEKKCEGGGAIWRIGTEFVIR
jgi:hypothetical protein